MRKVNESQGGFWGTVARKAKAILDDDVPLEHFEAPRVAHQHEDSVATGQKDGAWFQPAESHKKPDKAVLRKGFGAIASSLNYLGNALEEGLNIVENRTADIIQETRSRRLNVRKKTAPGFNKQPMDTGYSREQSATQSATQNQMTPVAQTDMDIQLQASRDVRC